MGAGIKRAREEEPPITLALSLSTDSASSAVTSADSGGAGAPAKRRRGAVVATSGEGEFVCKTCGQAFASFQALGGHRTSHLRGRHGLQLGVGVARAIRERQRQRHECHICGLGFEMGQALGGHMRGHREEMALNVTIHRWIVLSDQEAGHQAATHQPPVLLELFV